MKQMSKAEILYLSLLKKKAQIGDQQAQKDLDFLNKISKNLNQPTVEEDLERAKQEYQKNLNIQEN